MTRPEPMMEDRFPHPEEANCNPVIRLAHAIEVNRPTVEVFEFCVDYEQAHHWTDGLIHYEKLTPGPVSAGAEFIQQYKEGFEVRIRVTEYQPAERYDSEIEHKWLRTESRSRFMPSAQGTRIEHEFLIHLNARLLHVTGFMIEPFIRKKQLNSLEKLRQLLES